MFVRVKIALGWICNSAKTFYFPGTIKSTTNPAVSYVDQKTAAKLFKWGNL